VSRTAIAAGGGDGGGTATVETFDAVVVGAGFAGLSMIHRLRELNLRFVVFETGEDVGGTWYWNRYPGARVDLPSLQYSLSFSSELEQDWDWPEMYSPQEVLAEYTRHVADRFDMRRDIRFGTTVTSASYEDARRRWFVTTDRDESVRAKYLICASGSLSAPNVPDFAGLETFRGEWYHTSRWPTEKVDLTGKRVGIIGTGSTGIQVVPVVAAEAEHLTVFQRTPNFSLPSMNQPMDPEFAAEWKRDYAGHRERQRMARSGSEVRPFPDRSALSVSPEEREQVFESTWGDHITLLTCFNDIMTNPEANDAAAEFVRDKIRGIVRDPETAELLCPKGYPIGTKRICLDSGYYETFNRENVTLVDVQSDPIARIEPDGLSTVGAHYALDVIIFATGFDAVTGPLFRMNIRGRDGVALADKWADGPRAYLGLTTSGFPNLFMITGPGSPSVVSNVITAIEQHVTWLGRLIEHMERSRFASVEPEVSAEDEWVEHVATVANATLFPRANSWYMGANIPGKPRVFMLYVGGVGRYRTICEEVAADGYRGFAFAGPA
jgi:cyclohexanone monooxygenase